MASSSSFSADDLTATCHCARISLTVPHQPTKINECRCTVCYKLGAWWSYFPRAEVKITITPDPSSNNPTSPTTFLASEPPVDSEKNVVGLQQYLRADSEGRLAFVSCAHCGALTHWWAVAQGETPKMGVNSRLFPEKTLVGVEHGISRC